MSHSTAASALQAIKTLLDTIEYGNCVGFVEIFHDSNGKEYVERYTKFDEMCEALKKRGVLYEKWEASKDLSAEQSVSNEQVLDAYKDDIKRIMDEYNFIKADVCQMTADNPKKTAFRKKFLSEHTHNEEEVRFFVDGAACFYLHLPEIHEVIRIECSAGHLLVVPALTKHWFDMGENPFFRAIRFFGDDEGWVPEFTQSKIDLNFPYYTN